MINDPSTLDIGWRSSLMFALCLPILLASAFIISRDVERRATIWLVLLLVAAVISQIPQIIGFAGAYGVWPGLTFAPFNTELYLGPLFYLHADRLMRSGPLGWRKWLLAPGAAQTLYYTAMFLFLGDYKAKWAYNDAFHLPYVIPIETLIAIGLGGWSLWAVFGLIGRYRVFLKDTHSAAHDFDPTWLNRLMMTIVPAAVIFALLEFVFSFIVRVSYTAAFPFQLFIMASLVWLSYEALARLHEPFPKMPPRSETALKTSASKPEKDWSAEGVALRQAILDGKWHLEPRLTIADVAARRATNETYISRALNQGLGLTFTGLINQLRIDHAKAMLTTSDMPVLEVALSSGFNSKATFNRVFKEREALTPSAYRTQYRGSQTP